MNRPMTADEAVAAGLGRVVGRRPSRPCCLRAVAGRAEAEGAVECTTCGAALFALPGNGWMAQVPAVDEDPRPAARRIAPEAYSGPGWRPQDGERSPFPAGFTPPTSSRLAEARSSGGRNSRRTRAREGSANPETRLHDGPTSTSSTGA